MMIPLPRVFVSKKTALIIAVLAFCFFGLSATANAATYYVSVADGNDTNCTGLAQTAYGSGSAQPCPWKTITKVNGITFSPGDSILFKRGETWSNSRLIMDESGNSISPITIGAYGSDVADPIIDAAAAQNYAIYTAAATYVTIEHLDLRGGTSYGLSAGGSNLILNYLTVSGGLAGIRLQGSSNSTISNTNISGITGGAALYISTASTGIMISNVNIHDITCVPTNPAMWVQNTTGATISNVTIQRASVYGATLDTNTSLTVTDLVVEDSGSSGVIVSNNSGVIITNLDVSGSLLGGNGVSVGASNSNIIIQDSTAYNNTGDGFSFTGTGSGNVVKYSTSYSNGDPTLGASGDGFTSHDSVGVSFQYVVGYLNQKSCFAIVGSGNGSITNATCWNNYEASQPGNWGVYIGSTGNWSVSNVITANHEYEFFFVAGSHVTGDYNIAYDSRGGSAFYWLGTAYEWGDYKAVSGQDDHSLNSNPQFSNPATYDFSLLSNSPAIDSGTNLGSAYAMAIAPGSTWPNAVSTLNQNSYGSAWDIGAYVYLSVSGGRSCFGSLSVGVSISGGSATTSDAKLFLDSSGMDRDFTYTLACGTHIISASLNSTYTSAFSGDCSADGPVIVDSGTTKSCMVTFTSLGVPSASPPPTPTSSPVPSPSGGSLSAYQLTEGDVISGPSDPDVYIVNEWGFKRLFLNPIIFSFYSHLGDFSQVKPVSSDARTAFPTSGLFRNCETNDQAVYGVEITGEDTGTLHHINISGDTAVSQDPNFFQKVFCINSNEFSWYTKGSDYTNLSQIPMYMR